MNKNMHTLERGITLLITLLLMSVLLGVSSALLSITMKQYKLSGIARSSETAFQAANAGMECVLYRDQPPPAPVSGLEVPGGVTPQTSPATLNCMDQDSTNPAKAKSGDEQLFEYTWGSPSVCTKISVYKYYNTSVPEPIPAAVLGSVIDGQCTTGTICTIVKSRGYDVACGSIGNERTVERELTQRY